MTLTVEQETRLKKAFNKRPGAMTLEEYILVCDDYRPEDYSEYGDENDPLYENGWRSTGFSTHRDVDLVGKSNWEVISKDLMERFPNHIKICNAGHWAVGWLDSLRVRLYNPKTGRRLPKGFEALEAAYDWHRELESYPVADDDDYSRREMEAIEEAFDEYRKAEIVELVKTHLPGICRVDREAQGALLVLGEDPDDLKAHPELLSFDLEETREETLSDGEVITLKPNEQFAYLMHSDGAFYYGVDEMWINDELFVDRDGTPTYHVLDAFHQAYTPIGTDYGSLRIPQYEPYEKWLARVEREEALAAGQMEMFASM